MARVFISHSSADNDQAAQIKAWLTSAGFESAFLDKDKTTGIPPSADWERTLYRAVEQSQAMIIIQTPNWLASKWCFAEFTQARALGKAIFPAILAPTGDTLISPDIQALNLLSDRDGGLERLKGELVRIALDAQGGFEWGAKRRCLTLQAYKALGDEAAGLGPLENAVRKAADTVLDEAKCDGRGKDGAA
jgi:hypothetical protein